jgi:hypothetical protein
VKVDSHLRCDCQLSEYTHAPDTLAPDYAICEDLFYLNTSGKKMAVGNKGITTGITTLFLSNVTAVCANAHRSISSLPRPPSFLPPFLYLACRPFRSRPGIIRTGCRSVSRPLAVPGKSTCCCALPTWPKACWSARPPRFCSTCCPNARKCRLSRRAIPTLECNWYGKID